MRVVIIVGLFLNFIGSIFLLYSGAKLKYDKDYKAMIAEEPNRKLFRAGLWLLCIGFGMQIVGVVIPYFQK